MSDLASRLAVLLILMMACRSPAAFAEEGMHTFDGKHSIASIEVTAVYFVPTDRPPLADWRERADYFARRIEAFHRREFDGQSSLKVKVRTEPFRSAKTSEAIRGGDPNQTFYNTVNEARETLKWPGEKPSGFPILLVLSEINWRELDDFRRVRLVDGVEKFDGHIGREGRHFPGAEAGGARAAYWDDPGFGLGLVSADGWRVPYSGSDCVIYHEGVGHTIGLPHPEPIDGSVMGLAQYEGWLNETFVDEKQKRKLGWVSDPTRAPRPATLFDAFTALPSPSVPRPGKPVALEFHWPGGAKLQDLKVRYQTELDGPWREVPASFPLPGDPPTRLSLAPFERATPVSYRVDATLADGQVAELWGYFQVK